MAQLNVLLVVGLRLRGAQHGAQIRRTVVFVRLLLVVAPPDAGEVSEEQCAEDVHIGPDDEQDVNLWRVSACERARKNARGKQLTVPSTLLRNVYQRSVRMIFLRSGEPLRVSRAWRDFCPSLVASTFCRMTNTKAATTMPTKRSVDRHLYPTIYELLWSRNEWLNSSHTNSSDMAQAVGRRSRALIYIPSCGR